MPVAIDRVAEEAWTTVDTGTATLSVDDSATIEADRSYLVQVFENLFRNAIQHVGEDVTVRVGIHEDGFYVEDDGPGIPEGERETVFEGGHTDHEAGTGFGLAIVQQIAEAHGWSVTVTGGTDGGARFEFEGVERSTESVTA